MAEAEKTRYSDAELEEFKQLILKKLETARADYELLRATITHTASNDTEDTSPTFKVLEEGATTLSKEESGRLAAHQMKFIRNLEMALVRIENKTYGCMHDIRHLQNHRQADPQGAADESASRNRVHRGQRRTDSLKDSPSERMFFSYGMKRIRSPRPEIKIGASPSGRSYFYKKHPATKCGCRMLP